MAVIDSQNENAVPEAANADGSVSLKDELKKTARSIGTGAAIFVFLMAVYQTMAMGTPEYAALFVPALIMFIYVFWILYASKNQLRFTKDEESADNSGDVPDWNNVDPTKLEDSTKKTDKEKCKVAASKTETLSVVSEKDRANNKQLFCRSYSVS